MTDIDLEIDVDGRRDVAKPIAVGPFDIRDRINAETVNDRAKLIMHRIAARRLGREADILIDAARRVLEDERRRGPGYRYLDEWEALLERNPRELRRLITQRSDRMSWLRSTSPFGRVLGLTDPTLRRRIWRLARRGAERPANR